MKSLLEFINESLCGLENIFVVEELEYINDTYHSNCRKKSIDDQVGSSDNLGGVKNKHIYDIFTRVNDIIENDCLNDTIKINESEIGIDFKSSHYDHIVLIFWVTKFNKENFKYDIKLKTVERYKRSKIFKFNNVLYYLDIDGKRKTKKFV